MASNARFHQFVAILRKQQRIDFPNCLGSIILAVQLVSFETANVSFGGVKVLIIA